MFRTRSRPRRLWLGAAVAACSLAGFYGGSASAALNLDTSTDTNIAIDSDTHSFQGNLRPVTLGDYQYFAYWDAVDPVDGNVYLMLTRRRITTGSRVTLRFDGTGGGEALVLAVPFDGHNYVGLGISPNDGRIHLSWSLHDSNREHNYVKSAVGCTSLSQTDFTFNNCSFVHTDDGHVNSSLEQELTYPTYFNDSRGRLYFGYRYDASARGDEVLQSYNDDGSWTERGTVFRGRRDGMVDNTHTYDVDGAGPRRPITTVERGIYIEEWEFDSRDRLHAVWIWKEHNRPLVWRHGLNYAYSDDFGESWYYENNRRTGQIADLSDGDPITIRDLTQTEVYSVPPGWDIGATGFELDSNGNPHTVVPTNSAQQPDDASRYHLQTHYWRTTDKRWYAQPIETTGDVRQGMTALPGEIFFDKADKAYAIFARNTVDWLPYNRDIYRQTELPWENVTWQAESGSDGVLDVRLYSSYSCLQTTDNIATALDLSGNDTVRVNLVNNTDARDVTISWVTTASPAWSSLRMETFRGVLSRSGSSTETLRITNAEWRDTLAALEICFDGDPDNRGDLQIDWIDVYNSRARTSAKTWDFLAPIEMYAAEASQADNWSTWRVEELFPGDGVYVTPPDGYWFQDRQRYKDSGRVEFNIHQQGSPGTEILSLRSFGFVDRNAVLKDWRFDADPMGWTAHSNGHVRDFAWRDDGARREKGISGGLNGRDPALLSAEALDVPINRGRYLHVVMKNTSAARLARVWFRTATDRTWTTRKSAQFAITANSGYTPYSIDMQAAGMDPWDRQLLYQIEIDPSDDATVTGTFVIDRIWIDNTR